MTLFQVRVALGARRPQVAEVQAAPSLEALQGKVAKAAPQRVVGSGSRRLQRAVGLVT